MMDNIGVVYAGRQNERTQRIAWVPSTPKIKKTRHDISYRCCICLKTKGKNGKNHIAAVNAKTKQEA